MIIEQCAESLDVGHYVFLMILFNHTFEYRNHAIDIGIKMKRNIRKHCIHLRKEEVIRCTERFLKGSERKDKRISMLLASTIFY